MIIFRTDASIKTGFGHLRRSTYLASLLKSKTDILFCISSGSDKIVTRYLDEKKWSYCSLKQLKQLASSSVKSVVFDLRYFSDEDTRLIHQAKTNNWTTVQVTDLGLNQQEVDYTIDASIDKMFSYNKDKKVLDGPDYAILHHKFRHFHNVKRKYREKIKKVFICFGGAVEYRKLRKMIDLLSRHRWEIKIAPGFYLKRSGQKTLRRIYPGIHFVGNTESLARPFFEADVALISPGVAAYEAAAAGTPALYFYYQNEQKFIANSLEKKEVGLEISNIDDLFYVNLVEKMNALTLEKRIDMGSKAKQLVDARGVYRIIDFFEQHKII
jgi:spore coat polysaccharide biosynthesis predicted glycosyltransferase SpsG